MSDKLENSKAFEYMDKIVDGNDFVSFDNETECNYSPMEDYEESEDRVPIIRSSEVLSFLRDNHQEVDIDTFTGLSAFCTNKVKPFWAGYMNGSIFIMMDQTLSHEHMYDVLSYFNSCEHVYVGFCRKIIDFIIKSVGEDREQEDCDNSLGCNPFDPTEDYLVFRSMILDFSGDVALVRFKDWDELVYSCCDEPVCFNV